MQDAERLTQRPKDASFDGDTEAVVKVDTDSEYFRDEQGAYNVEKSKYRVELENNRAEANRLIDLKQRFNTQRIKMSGIRIDVLARKDTFPNSDGVLKSMDELDNYYEDINTALDRLLSQLSESMDKVVFAEIKGQTPDLATLETDPDLFRELVDLTKSRADRMLAVNEQFIQAHLNKINTQGEEGTMLEQASNDVAGEVVEDSMDTQASPFDADYIEFLRLLKNDYGAMSRLVNENIDPELPLKEYSFRVMRKYQVAVEYSTQIVADNHNSLDLYKRLRAKYEGADSNPERDSVLAKINENITLYEELVKIDDMLLDERKMALRTIAANSDAANLPQIITAREAAIQLNMERPNAEKRKAFEKITANREAIDALSRVA